MGLHRTGCGSRGVHCLTYCDSERENLERLEFPGDLALSNWELAHSIFEHIRLEYLPHRQRNVQPATGPGSFCLIQPDDQIAGAILGRLDSLDKHHLVRRLGTERPPVLKARPV